MRIIIEYESSWRNSFLDGDNNSELPKKGRKFIASVTTLKKNPDNFKKREITLDTVMGLLNRLIGDQRKLYQARDKQFSKCYFFEELEERVTFEDKTVLSNEMVYLRNMEDSNDQQSFSGFIKLDNPLFTSNYSCELWSILELSFEALCDFIIGNPVPLICKKFEPLYICDLFEKIAKEKRVLNEGIANQALLILQKKYSEGKYLKDNNIVLLSMYCSALYLQLERLGAKFDLSSALTKQKCITGISKNGLTKKDFISQFTSGGRKKIFGNPYFKEEKIKGLGKVKSMLTKASGQLEITIDIDNEKSAQIKQLIENAAVSSFYLGKKGLAYVSKIQL